MGKLDVAMLRYLTAEDFRVLTAVSVFYSINKNLVTSKLWYLFCYEFSIFLGGNGYEEP